MTARMTRPSRKVSTVPQPESDARARRQRAAYVDQSPIVADAYHQVKERLSEVVERFAAAEEYQLPAEEQLSTMLGVSRPTIRSALLALQKEGKIQRFHGRGTFINKHALRMKANLAEDRPFLFLLEKLGYQASLRTLAIDSVVPAPEVAELLDIEAGQKVCAVDRIFEADGKPAVLSRDHVPLDMLGSPVAELEPGDSTFSFIRENTPGAIQYSIAELIPTVADARTSAQLEVPRKHPMLLIRHLHLDQRQVPIAVTDAVVNDAILRFSIVRTYLDS